MRISKRFQLGVSQAELDFVDIDTRKDTHLFLDPYFLALGSDPWSIDASNTIKSFFTHFLTLLRAGRPDLARDLFRHLHEPNETCLGLSRRAPRGRGVGSDDAQRIFDSLTQSRAAQSGLLNDLEDCKVFVPGIDKDKTSDMTTNIIRRHLITYTAEQCLLWGLPLTPNSPSGFFWNPDDRAWQSEFTDNLIVEGRRILLVPKSAVTYCKKYTAQKYHRHFVLTYLQHENLRLGTSIVRTKRVRRRTVEYVTKKDVIARENAGFNKDYLARFTEAHFEIFREFKSANRTREESLDIQEFAQGRLSEICNHLSERLKGIPDGNADAAAYHRTVVGILDLLFYPRLTKPAIEQEIHEGRKRIDLVLDNGAKDGFFAALSNQSRLPSRFIFVECKNYGKDVNNPEIDQLSGRFSPNRGQVGLLLCRGIRNEALLLDRCKDTFYDDRGLILPLTDSDLLQGLKERAEGVEFPLEARLTELQRTIALRER